MNIIITGLREKKTPIYKDIIKGRVKRIYVYSEQDINKMRMIVYKVVVFRVGLRFERERKFDNGDGYPGIEDCD